MTCFYGVNGRYLKVYLRLWKLTGARVHNNSPNAFADDIATIAPKDNDSTFFCDLRLSFGRKAMGWWRALTKPAWRRSQGP